MQGIKPRSLRPSQEMQGRPTPSPSTTSCLSILQKEVVTIWEAMALEETLILQHVAAGFLLEVLHVTLAAVLSLIPVPAVPSPLKVPRVFGEMPVVPTLAPLQHEREKTRLLLRNFAPQLADAVDEEFDLG